MIALSTQYIVILIMDQSLVVVTTWSFPTRDQIPTPIQILATPMNHHQGTLTGAPTQGNSSQDNVDLLHQRLKYYIWTDITSFMYHIKVKI